MQFYFLAPLVVHCFKIACYPSFGCARKWSISTYASILARSLSFIYFCSELCYLFLLLTLSLNLFFILVPWDVKLGCLYEIFLFLTIYNYHHKLLSKNRFYTIPHVWVCCVSISFVSRFKKNFSLGLFFDLLVVLVFCLVSTCLKFSHLFSCWFLVLYHCGKKRCLIWFQPS